MPVPEKLEEFLLEDEDDWATDPFAVASSIIYQVSKYAIVYHNEKLDPNQMHLLAQVNRLFTPPSGPVGRRRGINDR